MFFEDAVLEPDTRRLLKKLGKPLSDTGFFLVRGTALALQLGHRKSIDLDFFTLEEFDTDELLELVRVDLTVDRIAVDGRAEQTLNLTVAGVKIDLIRYRYPLLEPLIETGDYAMLGIPDIAAMKLAAITNRGSRKDFFDLHFLLQKYSIHELLDFYKGKFPDHDAFFVIRSLAYFDDAESEPDPVLLQDVAWERVRQSALSAMRAAG